MLALEKQAQTALARLAAMEKLGNRWITASEIGI